MKTLLPIVEGDGDLAAVPILLRKILSDNNLYDISLLPAQKRGEWPKVKRDFERYYLSARLERSPIIWVLDFDCDFCKDCTKETEWFNKEIKRIDSTGRAEIAFVVMEFESLFLYDEDRIRSSFPEFPLTATLPKHPEDIRDAKGWISKNLPKGRAYKPAVDQARLAQRLNLEKLRGCSASFDRLEKSILSLIWYF